MTVRTLTSALAVSTLLLASACSGSGLFGEIHKISVEAGGTGGPAAEVTYQLPGGGKTVEKNVTLPWKKEQESEFTPVSLTVTPTAGGTATCRIAVDGKTIHGVTGEAGEAVNCEVDSFS